jgi:hypothetical protein
VVLRRGKALKPDAWGTLASVTSSAGLHPRFGGFRIQLTSTSKKYKTNIQDSTVHPQPHPVGISISKSSILTPPIHHNPLKMSENYVAPAQQRWLRACMVCSIVMTYAVRPSFSSTLSSSTNLCLPALPR